MRQEKTWAQLLAESKKTPEFHVQKVMMDFLRKVESQMERKNIRRTDLADLLGTSKAYVTRLFNFSTANFTIETMTRIALAVGLQPVELKCDLLDQPLAENQPVHADSSEWNACDQRLAGSVYNRRILPSEVSKFYSDPPAHLNIYTLTQLSSMQEEANLEIANCG